MRTRWPCSPSASPPSRWPAAALDVEGAVEAAESICRRLEGIPLAIELAAAQVGPASVAEVAARLGSRFDVLARSGFVWPRRHVTLRTAIGWSHELCAPLERLLWARLTVFRGSFDLSSACAVTSGGPLDADAVHGCLERLVAQSVVRRDGARYRMLDTIREYGREWLHELGEVRRARLPARDALRRTRPPGREQLDRQRPDPLVPHGRGGPHRPALRPGPPAHRRPRAGRGTGRSCSSSSGPAAATSRRPAPVSNAPWPPRSPPAPPAPGR